LCFCSLENLLGLIESIPEGNMLKAQGREGQVKENDIFMDENRANKRTVCGKSLQGGNQT